MQVVRPLLVSLAYAWVLPNSLLGLAAYLVCRWVGARSIWVDGVLEVSGPGIGRLLDLFPVNHPISAITLGHVVLGRDEGCLDRTRLHERVHVRQYQRWGPAFVPAYLLASLFAWVRGRDAYRDNPFEREAYAVDDCRGRERPANGVP